MFILIAIIVAVIVIWSVREVRHNFRVRKILKDGPKNLEEILILYPQACAMCGCRNWVVTKTPGYKQTENSLKQYPPGIHWESVMVQKCQCKNCAYEPVKKKITILAEFTKEQVENENLSDKVAPLTRLPNQPHEIWVWIDEARSEVSVVQVQSPYADIFRDSF